VRVSNKPIGGCLIGFQYDLLLYILIVRLKAMILVRSVDLTTFLTVAPPGPQINLIPGAGLNFFIDIRYTHARPILVVCGLLLRENNLTRGFH
jgi:hypothetical protein